MAVATGAAYFVVALATIALTRFGGGVACLWFAGAVQIAGLVVRPRREWPGILLACAAASAVATAWVGVGPVGAVPLALINMLEGVIAAHLLHRFDVGRDPLDSLGRLTRLVFAVGVAAPLATAPLGAAVVSRITGTSFFDNLVLWMSAHALGNISAVPILGFVASGAVGRWVRNASPERLAEAAGLVALTVGVTAGVFAQNGAPLLFAPVLPAMVTTFRVGRMGAAASVLIIAGVGGLCTVVGSGPVHLLDGDQVQKSQFFLLYLAATVLTILPVAADLRRRRTLFNELRESEARYRLLADNSTDIVLNLDVDGTIRYASPSIAQLGGFTPESVLGRNAVELVLPEHRAEVTRAHLAALEDPDSTVAVEYRAATASGEVRWFETHTRGFRNGLGEVTGVVSAIRDISQRKAVEGELSRAAATDPLTGLANRRVFDAALDRVLGAGGRACVAVVDLDHFKQVNDRFGHEAGDRVLARFAELARGSLRDGDLVARLGGEEFGVLLPSADVERAQAVCERLRLLVAATGFPAGRAVLRVTASIGLAEVAPGATRADVMRAADEALYRAKAEGRDRLRLAA
ncbi:sensor domain-containing diguanylate cyclase [Sphingomonas lenta]|uniref:sensor domain-containing diguanylate cyclase n=1 Tax=Sphingomonas lenta TaxID=1141887 RepID=UPI001596281B|nr:sensor domain-containing diguanylate cyclase [Sphingomonas lenta]